MGGYKFRSEVLRVVRREAASSRPRRRKRGQRKRCGALVKGKVTVSPTGAVRARNPRCRKWAIKGKARCHMHGGLSTGPKTPEGKARVIAAMVEGRCKWIERLKAEGTKIPCGRKSGAAWTTPRMRARLATREPAYVKS